MSSDKETYEEWVKRQAESAPPMGEELANDLADFLNRTRLTTDSNTTSDKENKS